MTTITIRPGPSHRELIDAAQERLAEARRVANGWHTPGVAAATDELEAVQRGAVCPSHHGRTLGWLGVDTSVACCVVVLPDLINTGRVVVANPTALEAVAADPRYEPLDQAQALALLASCRRRATELAAGVVNDLEAIVAAGGEPLERLRAALMTILAAHEHQLVDQER